MKQDKIIKKVLRKIKKENELLLTRTPLKEYTKSIEFLLKKAISFTLEEIK